MRLHGCVRYALRSPRLCEGWGENRLPSEEPRDASRCPCRSDSSIQQKAVGLSECIFAAGFDEASVAVEDAIEVPRQQLFDEFFAGSFAFPSPLQLDRHG